MIASMQGNAVGFGFELALQCDLRIAADDCVVALPEARVGMLPAGGASQTLPRVVGTSAGARGGHDRRARGARSTPSRVGSSTRSFPVPSSARTPRRVPTRSPARPTAAVRAAKAAVWTAVDLPLDVGLRREADLAAALRR